MSYPDGYQEAEHRRALGALLGDVLEQRDRAMRAAAGEALSTVPSAPVLSVLAAASTAGRCELVLSMTLARLSASRSVEAP